MCSSDLGLFLCVNGFVLKGAEMVIVVQEVYLVVHRIHVKRNVVRSLDLPLNILLLYFPNEVLLFRDVI